MSKLPKALSPGECLFAAHCDICKLAPEREFLFHPDRKWRFDFCWPREKVAVEIDGGTAFGKSAHSKGAGYENDCRKANEAAIREWLVYRFTTEMVFSGEAIDMILRALGRPPR
jgi:hypothetical protein